MARRVEARHSFVWIKRMAAPRAGEANGERLFLIAVAALLCGGLGWRIFTHLAGDLFGAERAATAIQWDATHPDAASALARDELERGDAADGATAKRYAERLLLTDPLAPGALSLYGLAVERIDGPARAHPIMQRAGRNLPLDVIAHGWLYEYALDTQDNNGVIAELDILLRGRPGLAAEMTKSLADWLDHSDSGRAAMLTTLERNPPWRTALLHELAGSGAQRSTLLALFKGLIASTAPAKDEEIGPFFERLIRDSEFDDAYAIFLRRLPPDNLTRMDLLFNGAFQRPIANLPFDWQLTPVSGARVELAEARAGKALHVVFYGAQVNFAHVRHLLALAPGRYVLSGVAESVALESAVGLQWRLSCLKGQEPLTLATTAPLRQAQPPEKFSVVFSVPAEACAFQELRLETPARIAAETYISGEAKYGAMSINRAGP